MTEFKQVQSSTRLQCCNCDREFDSCEKLSRCSGCDHLLVAVDISSDRLVGTTIAGKYKIVKLAASGGMGCVYQAFHEHLQVYVAIKVLPDSGEITKVQLERFQQEAKLASLLLHPNIARILDFGVDPCPYIVMDYVVGETLASLIARDRAIPQDRLLDIAIQIADAMTSAHAAGLVHRDLKPSNIMIEAESGAVKIIDFGLAKEFVNDVKLTRTGETVGSPPYMSPEQCRGEQLDARSDIYSLGCLLYESFTGVVPFAAENMISAIFKHLETEAPSFKTARPGFSFPKGMELVVRNCLHKKPAERYQTMSALKADLEAVAIGKSSKLRSLKQGSGMKQTFPTVMKIASSALTVIMLICAAAIFWSRQAPGIVPNENRLALGPGAKNKGIVSIELNQAMVLNGKSKEQIFSIRQEQLNAHKDLLAAQYKPLPAIFEHIDYQSPWFSSKGLCFSKQDGLIVTDGDSWESDWLLNPLLLVKAVFNSGLDWNKRLIGDPAKVKDFPYQCKPEALSWNPPSQLIEVTYDMDKYIERVMEVDDWKVPPSMVDSLDVSLGSMNARDLGYNYMTVEIEGKDNAAQVSGPTQLATSLVVNMAYGCKNNHTHSPDGSQSWYSPVRLHLPCTEKISLYREKPRSTGQKPDMTCLIHFNYKRDDSLNSLEFLEKRKAEIVETEGPDAAALLSIYRRMGDKYLKNKKLPEAQESYGHALKIASEKFDRELNSVLPELAGSIPAETSDAQLERLARQLNWLPCTLSTARGAIFYLHNNPDQAINDFNAAISQRPACASIYSWRASTMQLMGRYKEAIADYTQVSSLDKDWACDEQIKECRDKMKFELGAGLVTAIANITRPTGIPRTFASSYQQSGLTEFKSGRYGDATRDFKQFIELEGWDKSLKSTYSSIFGSLSSRFAHDEDSSANLLSTAEPRTKSGTWPHPAISYLQGHITEKQLLDLAGTDKGKLTEAWTYIGFDLLLKNHPAEGKAYLRQVVEKGDKTFMEYGISADMLRKLR